MISFHAQRQGQTVDRKYLKCAVFFPVLLPYACQTRNNLQDVAPDFDRIATPVISPRLSVLPIPGQIWLRLLKWYLQRSAVSLRLCARRVLLLCALPSARSYYYEDTS